MAGKRSGIAGLQRPECPFLVVFTEKGLSKLVAADHNGAGWGHFDHPGEETWATEATEMGSDYVLSAWTDA